MIKIIISLVPSLLFLFCLQLFDSYKLVNPKTVVRLILLGCAAALTAYLINVNLITKLGIDWVLFSRYAAPVIEEFLKASFIIYFLYKKRIAFLVDGAIFGFSIGAGFAVLENIYYLNNIGEANIAIWILRGFGTAIMHGCATAVYSMFAKYYSDKKEKLNPAIIMLILFVPVFIHGFFNSFVISPFAFSAMQLIISPTIFYMVFLYSEKQMKSWMEISLESNQELISAINAGRLLETKAGKYLQSLQDKFSPLVRVDLLCYIRLYVELSMYAKGFLIMKEVGIANFKVTDIKEKIYEINYLEKKIGFTGKLAIQPIIYNEKGLGWIKEMLMQE
jgi:protease PrsW